MAGLMTEMPTSDAQAWALLLKIFWEQVSPQRVQRMLREEKTEEAGCLRKVEIIQKRQLSVWWGL